MKGKLGKGGIAKNPPPRIRRTTFSLLFALVCSTAQHLTGGVLHSVLLVDLYANDIGATVSIDQKRVSEGLLRIAHLTGLESRTRIFTGVMNGPEQLLHHLEQLAPEAEDLVFFYYAGHGFRYSEQASPWPLLYYSRQNKTLALQQVIDLLQTKSQHLTFVIADCCNNILPRPPISERSGYQNSRHHLPDTLVRDNYARLFLEERGTWIAVGAEPGLYSYCDTRLGGYFTHALFKSLEEITDSDPDANWPQILEATSRKISSFQIPQYLSID